MRIGAGGTKAFTPVLRESSPELTRARQATYCGMAHFAGSGPLGQSCQQCASFHLTMGTGGKLGAGVLGRCNRFRQLTGRPGESFPGQAEACKYFTTELKPARAKPRLQGNFAFDRQG